VSVSYKYVILHAPETNQKLDVCSLLDARICLVSDQV